MDADELEATHAEWLRNAKKGCRELDAAGATYNRVVVGGAGSSPRARGTLRRILVRACGNRFIPARAGNTWRWTSPP